MKRILSFLVLPLFTLSACAKPIDPKTAYQAIMESMTNHESYTIDGSMELKMDIPLDSDNPDSTLGLTIPIDMKVAITSADDTINMDMTMDLSILNQSINYDFYLRDQYIYMQVLDQKAAVPLDPSLQALFASTYTIQNDPSVLEDPNLQFDRVETDRGEGIKITMPQAYFDAKMDELSQSLGQANVNVDSITDFNMVQTIYYDDQDHTITHMDLNGQLSVSSIPINLSMSMDYIDYDSTTLVPITPSDFPITSDGSISADLPLSTMV